MEIVRERGSVVELVGWAFVGVGDAFFGGEAREASLTSGPGGARRRIVVRVRLGSGLMGRLAISSSVSSCSAASIPSSSLPRRFRRLWVPWTSDFGTGNALLVLGFGWLAVELFDWALGRDLRVGVGAGLGLGLLTADAGRAALLLLRRDDGDEVAEGGHAVDLGDFGEYAADLPAPFAGVVLRVLVDNFGRACLQKKYAENITR